MQDLQNLAEATLVEQLCVDNVKDAFLMADLYGSESLKSACGEFVRTNACQVMFHDGILRLKEEHPHLWQELRRYVDI
eukprot:scaffold351_cov148-Amphora_coffeaeformis.AAC.11